MTSPFTLYYEDTGKPVVVIPSTKRMQVPSAIDPGPYIRSLRTRDGLLVEETETEGRYQIDGRRFATSTPPGETV